MFILRWIAKTLLFSLFLIALILTALLPLVNVLAGLSWHDQERIGQIFVMALGLIAATLGLISRKTSTHQALVFDNLTRWAIAAVAAVGLLSSSLAWQPFWAFTEVALALGCLGIAWSAAVMRHVYARTVDRILLATLFFTCAGLTARFAVAYLAAVFSGSDTFNSWLLLDGFSNPRFYGQFLTLALPLLVAPLLTNGPLRRYAPAACVLAVSVWLIAITSGTRGTWLGLGVAAATLIWLGAANRRWVAWQCVAVAAALVLFVIFMVALPIALGMQLENSAVGRLTTSLSERGPLWQAAIDAIVHHPLLGIGPMQFAALPGLNAAHPHQAWLQWAAEWGLPSALVVTWLVLWGALCVLRVLRARQNSREESDVLRVCLAGALVASLTQAMVDGVIVMPYTQLWLALLAGWLVGLHPVQPADAVTGAAAKPRILSYLWPLAAWVAVGLLLFVVVRDYPNLAQHEQATALEAGSSYYKPRFWLQGVIGIRDKELVSTSP